ncbi:MAG: TusE/DsrC/DsvC family sulfur relay protein [Acidiferrobacterales bacterium]|jgi:TusE/DsrC/DsvC family sulfur relay protein|nr:TusE/DsrC/DsvC family sulfur relay protein [Acidiferrobacterales bacterium]
METVTTEHSHVRLDEDGLLVDPNDWNEDVAREMANSLGIGDLTGDHWQVIDALRKHYAQFGVAPAMNNVCHSLGKEWGWTHDLFHTCLNAWRIAGLPNPGEEAKSYLSGM